MREGTCYALIVLVCIAFVENSSAYIYTITVNVKKKLDQYLSSYQTNCVEIAQTVMQYIQLLKHLLMNYLKIIPNIFFVECDWLRFAISSREKIHDNDLLFSVFLSVHHTPLSAINTTLCPIRSADLFNLQNHIGPVL